MIRPWPHRFLAECCEAWHGAGDCPCACHQLRSPDPDPEPEPACCYHCGAALSQSHPAAEFACHAVGDCIREQPRAGLAERLAQELVTAELEHAARQFTTVAAQVGAGDSTQAQLRAARERLYAKARAFAAACPEPDR